VLEHACREGGGRAAEGGTWISVNLSARQVAQPDLLDVVRGALHAAGLAPSSLCLELTEAALLGVTPAIVTNLERLSELGVRLMLDDFGTGYSSFQHLKDFPIDMVKIDHSMVANLGRGEQDTAIVASVVSMASALGLSVIAEGVENEPQAEMLRELGCPFAQGYYFGPPA
jgi:EAL domain-containing protein (putative c-di-GMP-specific phosphodiesterase class I)